MLHVQLRPLAPRSSLVLTLLITACASDEPNTNGTATTDPSATSSSEPSQTVAPSGTPSNTTEPPSTTMPSNTTPASTTEPSVSPDPSSSAVAPTGSTTDDVAPDPSDTASVAPVPSDDGETSTDEPDAGSGVDTTDASETPVNDAGQGQNAVVYVGGYDYGSDTYPFRIYDLDKQSGALLMRDVVVDAGGNPSYIAAFGSHLYVANERDDSGGGLTSLSIAGDGALTRLNHQAGSDGGFTYVAVDPQGRFAMGASYNGGSVSLFPIEQDGSLGPELQTVDFGANAQSHSMGFDSSGRYVLVPNKGNDEVAQLVLSAEGNLTPNTPASVAATGGSGPRHLAISPDGDFVWVINELANSLTTYQLSDDGTLTSSATVSTLPDGFGGQNTGAHVEVSADGRFVYASNRGHNSIAVFSVGAGDGSLTLVEHQATGGSTPRDFDLDPRGDVVIVANQDSGTLTVFTIENDGSLEPIGGSIAGPPSPAAVQIVYLP